MTKARDDSDELLLARYLTNWLETSYPPETAAEVEKKVRDAIRKHLAEVEELERNKEP